VTIPLVRLSALSVAFFPASELRIVHRVAHCRRGHCRYRRVLGGRLADRQRLAAGSRRERLALGIGQRHAPDRLFHFVLVDQFVF